VVKVPVLASVIIATGCGVPSPPEPINVLGTPTLTHVREEPAGAATLLEFAEDGRCLVGRLHSGARVFHDLEASPDDSLLDCAENQPPVFADGLGKLTLTRADGTAQEFTARMPVRNGIALSRDERLLAAAAGVYEDGQGHRTHLEVWDTSTGNSLFASDSPLLGVWRIAFSGDGRVLAADSQIGGRAGVRAWSTDTFKPLLEVDEDPSHWMRGLALSADGRRLYAGGEDGVLHVYDVDAGTEIQQFGFGQVIESLAVSDDRLAVSLRDTTIRVYSLPF